jgi:hypothetical protein
MALVAPGQRLGGRTRQVIGGANPVMVVLRGRVTGYPGKGMPQFCNGLARSVRAEKPRHRAGADVEAEVVHGGGGAVALDQAARAWIMRTLQWCGVR